MIQFTPSNLRMWSRLGPSGAFGAAAMELGETDEKALLLSADMSYVSGLERFKAKYPERHYDMGIAEQNLVGAAAGLASEGFVPFATTYATFFAMRSADQVKMCLGYMGLNVKLVGTLAGFAAGILGATHMSIEDVALMRSIPNMTVVCPSDSAQIVKALLAADRYEGPVYIRLCGGPNLPAVYKEDFDFEIGKAISHREGEDVAIIASGTMLEPSLRAAEQLNTRGIRCAVTDMHTIKPLDYASVDAASQKRLVVTVEEHSVLGGLGGAVAEHMSQNGGMPPLLRLGVEDAYPHAGDYGYLLHACGLDAEGITLSIEKKWNEVNR